MKSNPCIRILAAFGLGQLVQVLLALVAKAMYSNRPVLWSVAGGFVILMVYAYGISTGLRNEVDP